MRKCRVNHCENEAKYIGSGLCSACQSRHYYWAKKTPEERVTHQAKLIRNAAAMKLLDPTIRLIRNRKRKSA